MVVFQNIQEVFFSVRMAPKCGGLKQRQEGSRTSLRTIQARSKVLGDYHGRKGAGRLAKRNRQGAVFKVPEVPERKKKFVLGKNELSKIVADCKAKTEKLLKVVVKDAMKLAKVGGLVTAGHVVQALKARREELVDPQGIWKK